MGACSLVRMMSLLQLDLRTLRTLLSLSSTPSSQGKFRKNPPLMLMETETVVVETLPEPPLMETETVVETLPELPLDVLMDILSLLEIPDLIRASSVCSFWCSAYSSLHSQLAQYKRPQTPCLLYASESDGENVACLYSLAEKRVYKLTLPDPPIRSRHLIGSSHGWLVTADDKSELHFLNPITGQQIALPSVITIEKVEPILDSAGTVNKNKMWDLTPDGYPSQLSDCLCIRAFVFPDPPTGSYIVVLIHNPEDYLSFARVGDFKWTSLPGKDYQQCIHMDGLLYAFTYTGGVYTFDLTGPTITRNTIADEVKNYISATDGYMYVVQAPWGDMLQVCRVIECIEGFIKTKKLMLYKADMAAKELVEMPGLHDHVLFLGRNQPQCLSVEEYPQLKTNCVYFTDDMTYISKYKNDDRDIGILNLENDSKEEIVSQLWCNWPNPIWITPNLTRMNM
uniref:F-box domain-containing protein n=1 Tax=Hordeum vulgare subsp. vulgare TaxID=112509 RepID=A0A8I6WN70_HORVV